MSQLVPNIALFIDADNISARNAASIINQLSTMGKITIKRAYGNWSKPHLKSWLTACHEHCVSTVQVSDYIIGKNSSDIQIVIDVMKVFYGKDIDIFALVTSDSDFTNLVVHLVEEQKHVIGFGAPNTPKVLMGAYSDFRFVLDEIPVETPPPAKPVSPPTQSPSRPSKNPNHDKELIAFIGHIIDTKGKNGALNTAILGSELRMHKTIDVGKYGFNKIGDLLKLLNDFDSYTENSTLMVARKQKPKPLDKQALDVAVLDEITLTNALSQAIALHQSKDNDGWVGINHISAYLQSNNGIGNMGYQSLFSMIDKLSTFQTSKQNGQYFVKDPRYQSDNTPVPNNQKDKQPAGDDLLDNHAFMSALRACIDDVQENGWSSMAQIGSALGKQGFSPKQFGYKNLTALIKALDIFELKNINNANWVKAINPKYVKQTQATDNADGNADNANLINADADFGDQGEMIDTNTISDDTVDTDTDTIADRADDMADVGDDGIDGDLSDEFIDNDLDDGDLKHKDLNATDDNATDNPTDEPTTTMDKVSDDVADSADVLWLDDLFDDKASDRASQSDNITQALIEALSQIDDGDYDGHDDSDNDDVDEIALEDALATAINYHQNADGWATIGDIGLYMRQTFGVKAADMGHRNFGELIATLPDYFELKKENRQSFAKIIVGVEQ